MNMHWLDWAIVAVFVASTILTVVYTKHHMRSVADFLSGSRCAGRYLLTMADAMGGLGAISMVAIWEMWYKAGWGGTWWAGLSAPMGLIITLSGWVIYRYRQTRAMTLAQFFEVRYSRRFRVLAGMMFYVSGVVNYGIFPAVGARFMMYFCGIPDYHINLGFYDFPATYAVIMLLMLGLAVWITLAGGQIAIMLSDFIQGMLALSTVAAISVFLLYTISWEQIYEALRMTADPENASLMNPFKTTKLQDFNIWYFLIGIFGSFYGCMAWQGNAGYNAAAKSPHEARMARILATWRGGTLYPIIGFLAVVAFVVYNHPAYANVATAAKHAIYSISSPTIQSQMTVSIVLSKFLPIGLVGILAAIMLSLAVTTDDTYLHSWGSIFIQDVVMPFRKKPFTPEEHIKWLRWSIAGVATFGFLFSLLFRQTQYILMFFAITGAIISGAGACIVGGLYWKRGTTGGAYCAVILGSLLAVLGVVIEQFPYSRLTMQIQAPDATAVTVNGEAAVKIGENWEYTYQFWRKNEWQTCKIAAKTSDGQEDVKMVRYGFGEQFPALSAKADGDEGKALTHALSVTPAEGHIVPVPPGALAKLFIRLRSINGQMKYFIAMLASLLSYVLVSLIRPHVFDMDRLLHRGQYAVKADVAAGEEAKPVCGWRALIGITPEFTKGDKILYYLTIGWSLFWILIFFGLLGLNLIKVRSDHFWLTFFKWQFLIQISIGFLTTIWFTIFGIRDFRDIFRTLNALKRDHRDDGWVGDHHNVGEETVPAGEAGNEKNPTV